MPLEMGLWRVDSGTPVRVGASGFPLESRLEELIQSDPMILGEPLLVIGRQVPTAYGKLVDLLAVGADGTLHVLELKRERTPRDVVAQVLDYGSWVEGLSHSEVLDIFASQHDMAFEVAFTDRFGISPPEELNGAHQLTVIASDVDPATERIIAYLAGFRVPVNVVFFRYYSDDGREYLARTWLLDEAVIPAASGKAGQGGRREQWNGRDWYVSFGEFPQGRNWDDARAYGFISAGGGAWFSKTLRTLPVGARVFVYIPQVGYVAVGTVTGEAARFDDAFVTVGGQQRKPQLVTWATGCVQAAGALGGAGNSGLHMRPGEGIALGDGRHGHTRAASSAPVGDVVSVLPRDMREGLRIAGNGLRYCDAARAGQEPWSRCR